MQIIEDVIKKIAKSLGWEEVLFAIEHPKDEGHGDYSCNIAMIMAKKLGKNPRELAEMVLVQCQKDVELSKICAKVEVAGAGFVNFYLKETYLLKKLQEVNTVGEAYGSNQELAGKTVIVEYTDPNPFKEFHIGHLMSNTIGEAIARLKAAEGANVVRANYQGDVGLHVAKSIWGMQRKMQAENLVLVDLQKMPLKERQKWMGQAYAMGAGEYEENELAKSEINSLNKQIYTGLAQISGSDPEGVMELYTLGREWSLAYFETIYARLGTKFDQYFFESETGKIGLEVVAEGLAKGVLELGDEGAVVYKGEKDGLHTRVFRNKLGLPTYEAKDLGLAKAKYGRVKYDQSIVVTANEIAEYFRVVLSVMKQLYPELAAKTVHKPHGMMKLSTGKMSSRTGKVVSGESLLEELDQVVIAKMGEREIANKESIADVIAIGSLKYSVLKQAIGGDIVYEPEKMTNMEGDTGAYLQYTYARIKSIIRKSQSNSEKSEIQSNMKAWEPEELAILRWIYRFPEVIATAAKNFAPHLVCSYLNELASRFNSFYAKCRVTDAPEPEKTARLQICMAVAQVVQNGLGILGIVAPDEM